MKKMKRCRGRMAIFRRKKNKRNPREEKGTENENPSYPKQRRSPSKTKSSTLTYPTFQVPNQLDCNPHWYIILKLRRNVTDVEFEEWAALLNEHHAFKPYKGMIWKCQCWKMIELLLRLNPFLPSPLCIKQLWTNQNLILYGKHRVLKRSRISCGYSLLGGWILL